MVMGAWNVTVIGYLRRDSLRLYTTPERILSCEQASAISHGCE